MDETSESDKRPRKIGFTIMKKVWTSSIFQTKKKTRATGEVTGTWRQAWNHI